jgi:predicted metal-dependent phosphoesterase TrpH
VLRVRFDLQSHSTCSDGTLEPAAVVAGAAAAGIELLALTDHDTVEGVPEAQAAARRHGLGLSPAAELSSVDGEHEDLHVLGYELDPLDASLRATLADFRADRERRILAMADALRALGLALEDAPLQARRAAGRPLGRPHLAQAVLTHPANAGRLAAEGIRGQGPLFERYLVPGAPAYVARTRPTVEEAIAVIHRAGGVAVWAHPFWDLDDPAAVLAALERFAATGLDGVEAFYITHSEEQTALLHAAAERMDLLATGSADFHGPEHERFHTFGAFSTYGLPARLGPLSRASSR